MGLEQSTFRTIIAKKGPSHLHRSSKPRTAGSKHAAAISAAHVPYCRAARSSRSTVRCFHLIPAAHAQNTRCLSSVSLCRARVRQRGAGNATLRLRSSHLRCSGTGVRWQRVGWRRHQRFALERRPGEQVHQHAPPLAVAVERRRLPRR